MTTDSSIRESRLVFYREHIDRIDRVLTEFLQKAGARSAFLIDKDGHLITRAGEVGEFDPDTISALVAGAFAATKEMAKLLGEREFSALFHQGERDNIQLSLVGERAILTILFDDATTLGMVRLYVTEAIRRLTKVFDDAFSGTGADDEGISESYDADAQKTLDSFFEEEVVSSDSSTESAVPEASGAEAPDEEPNLAIEEPNLAIEEPNLAIEEPELADDAAITLETKDDVTEEDFADYDEDDVR